MSHDKTLDTLCRLAEADRAAKAFDHVDINSTVQQCPASAPKIFVVPVRYALSEEPASHPASQPGVEPQSHPMAARLLRTGFIYVWQGRGPLQRYAMALNKLLRIQELDDDDTIIQVGSLSGFALDKRQEAWMLYSEIPLNPASYQQLSEPEHRAKRMRRLDLRQVANTLQAPHCAPLADAKSVMAELIPSTYDLALAVDYQRNQPALRKSADQLGDQVFKEPTPINIKAYTDAMRWLSEREKVAAHYPPVPDDVPPPGEWSAESWALFRTTEVLELAHNQAQGLYTVFACLDDDLGVLRDINHEQELVESRHEQWQADNNLRLSIGGFVRSLITEDGAEVAGNLSYRYREHDIELTSEQGKTLLTAHHRLDELFKEESRINQQRGGQYSHQQADALLHKVRADVQAAVAPVRGLIPSELHTEVESVIREYRAEKISNLENDHASAKVEQYIDLPRMNQWLDKTAPEHFAQVQQRHETLFADRGLYLPRHHSGTWYVDYSNSEHREWLDKLAMACLSAQCIRKQGAEQYADYVRSADEGALRQLFSGWSPSLEAAVNSTSRAGELITALGIENQANAEQALIKVLGPLGGPILADLSRLAHDTSRAWSNLIKRLGAALLLLGSAPGAPLKGPWLNIMISARVGSGIGLRAVTEGGRQVLQLFGKTAEDLTQWANTTGKAIGAGRVASIVNAPVIQQSGGVTALAALLLNSWNANNYLSQAGVLEGMDEQRKYDTASAVLYSGAALMAVIDSQVRKGFWSSNGMRVDQIKIGSSYASTLTLFGGVIGLLSSVAAFTEYQSLQKQLESATGNIDPWMKLRQKVVGGQAVVSGTQALLGFGYTLRSLSPAFGVALANSRYLMWMGPVNYLLAILGVLYLVTWYLQQTPVQNFLNYCCWSKSRAGDLSPISVEAQDAELGRLYNILYSPRVSLEGGVKTRPTLDRQGFAHVEAVHSLTIDLPGAEPDSAYLELAIIGDPIDTLEWRERVKNNASRERTVPPQYMQDIGVHWIRSSRCQWIPYQEGQGLRITGLFNIIPDLLGSQPRKVSLRLRYRTPVTAMLGAQNFMGGENGLAFTYTPGEGLIALRNDPTPELDKAQSYPLGPELNGQFLQPVRHG